MMEINAPALKALGENALLWSKTYCSLVEALRNQGVEEEMARAEARATATLVAFTELGLPDELESWEPCPLCGRVGT